MSGLERWFQSSKSRSTSGSVASAKILRVERRQPARASFLPHEIVAEICDSVIGGRSRTATLSPAEPDAFDLHSTDFLSILTVSKVCRLWRIVTLNSPRFWTRVTYQKPHLVQLFLTRSADHPLDIRGVEFRNDDAFNRLQDETDTPNQCPVTSILSLGSRVRSLQLDFNSIDPSLTTRLRGRLRLERLTNLTSLFIVSGDLIDLLDLLLRTPHLEVLEVSGGTNGLIEDSNYVEVVLPKLRIFTYDVARVYDSEEFVFCFRGPARPKTTINVSNWQGAMYIPDLLMPDVHLNYPSLLPMCHRWAVPDALALCLENCSQDIAFRVNASPISAAAYNFRHPGFHSVTNSRPDLSFVVQSVERRNACDKFVSILPQVIEAISFLHLTDLVCWGRDPVVSFDRSHVWDILLPMMPALRRVAIDISGVFGGTAIYMDYSIFAALKPKNESAEIWCPQLELIRLRAACLHEWQGMWSSSDILFDREMAFTEWGALWRKRTGRELDPRKLKHVKMEIQPMWTVHDILNCLKARVKRHKPVRELEIWCDDPRLDDLFADHQAIIPGFLEKFSFVTDGYERKRPRMRPLSHYFQVQPAHSAHSSN